MGANSKVLREPEVQASGQERKSAAVEALTGSEVLVDPQEVASLAYAYWLERGCPCDSPQAEKDADWYRAESCLKARIAATGQQRALDEPQAGTRTTAAGV